MRTYHGALEDLGEKEQLEPKRHERSYKTL